MTDPDSEQTIIDRQALMIKFDNDIELMSELVQILAQDAPQRLARIRDGLNRLDAEMVFTNAHSLKGAVGNFEAPRAHQAALNLEMLGRRGEMDQAPAALERLEREIERALAELRGIVAG